MGRQTCFLPRAPSNLVTPLGIRDAFVEIIEKPCPLFTSILDIKSIFDCTFDWRLHLTPYNLFEMTTKTTLFHDFAGLTSQHSVERGHI